MILAEEKSIDIKNNIDLSQITEQFDIILADPPWSYNDTNSRGAAVRHYSTMALKDIMRLTIPAKENSMLFLWGTSPLLPEALRVMEVWNFKYKSSMVWDKLAMGIGHYARIAHEFLLIGKRGKFPCPEPGNRFNSVFRARRRKHSEKPDIHYFIDRMYPESGLKKIELFARKALRPGWSYWGNEVKEVTDSLLFKTI